MSKLESKNIVLLMDDSIIQEQHYLDPNKRLVELRLRCYLRRGSAPHELQRQPWKHVYHCKG